MVLHKQYFVQDAWALVIEDLFIGCGLCLLICVFLFVSPGDADYDAPAAA